MTLQASNLVELIAITCVCVPNKQKTLIDFDYLLLLVIPGDDGHDGPIGRRCHTCCCYDIQAQE